MPYKLSYLRELKEALGSLVTEEERVEGGSWFLSAGTMIAKARVSAI